MDELEQERDVNGRLAEVLEIFLVRILSLQAVLEDLPNASALLETVSRVEARLRPSAHEQLKPLLADIRGLPLSNDPPMNLEEVARSLIESARNPPPE